MVKVLNCKKLHENAKLPVKTHDTDLGWDISCVRDDNFERFEVYENKAWKDKGNLVSEYSKTLLPGESYLFHTGIATNIPEGYGIIFRDRSSLGSKCIHVLAGVIDETYTGEWCIKLINMGKNPYTIIEGDRIIQAILVKNYKVEPKWVDELKETKRGDGGFGSSGK